jgi:hypothetical protein
LGWGPVSTAADERGAPAQSRPRPAWLAARDETPLAQLAAARHPELRRLREGSVLRFSVYPTRGVETKCTDKDPTVGLRALILIASSFLPSISPLSGMSSDSSHRTVRDVLGPQRQRSCRWGPDHTIHRLLTF